VLLNHLSEWVKQEPKSALAYLMRAWYYHETAWTVRAEDVGWKIPRRLYQEFTDDLQRANADVLQSINLNPRIPWSYYLVLLIATGEGNSPEAESAFQFGIKAFPDYYELYRQRLYSLTPKWGGSVGDMYAFAGRYAGGAPEDSPLQLLYLQLYGYLLNAVWFDCDQSLAKARLQECAGEGMKRLAIPKPVSAGLLKALQLYKVSDPIAFNNAVWPVFTAMAATPGSGSSGLGATLQVASSIMGSDNQLSHHPEQNSYVVDDVTAQVWVQMGNNSNAEQKFRDALDDIEHTSFADEAQRDQAMATVYDHMTEFARRTSQFMNTIVYYEAANTVGGINHGSAQHLKCWAYNHLKHYAEGVAECHRVLQQSYGNTLLSHYSLARAYEGLEQWDAALAEYTIVADSADNYLRVGAATEISLIYGSKKHDAAAELASLNQHPYLFDAKMQPPVDLAASFNNRCYAYMQLGQLEKALDDCTTSLRYDHIPDAFHKQQELMRRLPTRSRTL
jgi:tetratricopeptide (TPR) repeat protein